MERVTHKHVQAACDRFNNVNGTGLGCLTWADIRGDGTNRRGLYAVCNENGGVAVSYLRGKTMRETIANIETAIKFFSFPAYAVIIRAIHERGTVQQIAFDQLARRGLWLSDAQMQQARSPK